MFDHSSSPKICVGEELRQKRDIFGGITDGKDQHKNPQQFNDVSASAEEYSHRARKQKQQQLYNTGASSLYISDNTSKQIYDWTAAQALEPFNSTSSGGLEPGRIDQLHDISARRTVLSGVANTTEGTVNVSGT